MPSDVKATPIMICNAKTTLANFKCFKLSELTIVAPEIVQFHYLILKVFYKIDQLTLKTFA